MKKLIKALFTFFSVRSVANGENVVVSNFPDKYESRSSEVIFKQRLAQAPQGDGASLILNPLNFEEINEKIGSENASKDPLKLSIYGHGNKQQEGWSVISAAGSDYISIPEVIKKLNIDDRSQIRLSACYIGNNFEQIFDPESTYHKELKEALKGKKFVQIVLEGDEFQGKMGGDEKRFRCSLENKHCSIIESLIDSGEGLKFVFTDAEGELKAFDAKTFGRNGESWTIDNYRKYLQEIYEESKKFEVENGILDADAPRLEIDKLSDEQLHKSLGMVFTRYFSKLLDEKIRCEQNNLDVELNYVSEKISDLLESGFVNSFRTDDGETPIMTSIITKMPEIAQALIYLNSQDPSFTPYLNFKRKDSLQFSALHYALFNHFPQLIEPLIKAGADPNIKDGMGRTVLFLNEDPELVPYFVNEAGVDPNITDNEGMTAFMSISSSHISGDHENYMSLFKALGKFQKDVDQQNNDGKTALMIVFERNKEDGYYNDNLYLQMMRYLIENGADHSKIEEKDWDELFSRKWNKFISDQNLEEVKLALNKNNSRGSIPENSDDKDADLRMVENPIVEPENSATNNFRGSVLKHYDNKEKESDDDSSHNKSADTTLPLGSIAAVAVGVGVGVIACALNSGLKPKKGEEKTK